MSKKNKEKQLEIPERLFIQLYRYFVLDIKSPEQAQNISKELERKLDRITENDYYTTDKTSPSKEEAEKAAREKAEKDRKFNESEKELKKNKNAMHEIIFNKNSI